MRPFPSNRRRVIATYLMAGLVAMVLVSGGTLWASQQAGTREAISDARSKTQILAATSVAEIPDGLVTGDPAAIAHVDAEVRTSALGPDVARVKIWGADGTILYSDEPRLIGSTYPLGDEELHVLADGGIEAEISDLTKPENRFERDTGQMLEVYLPVTTTAGTPVLFEMYYRYDAVTQSANRIWLNFAPIILGGFLLLALVELPLAWMLATRVKDDAVEKSLLLQAAVDSSESERHRIASDLHDGVVQDLTGVSYALAATATTLRREGSPMADGVADAADHTRTAVSALRSLLVEIYPPSLREAGLAIALDGLVASIRSRGIATTLDVDPDLHLTADTEALLFRAAQEALRNVAAHADALKVTVTLVQRDSTVRLTVIDDGVGVGSGVWDNPVPGHAGLRLLSDLVTRAGGSLDLGPGGDGGTVFSVELLVRGAR